MMRPTAAQTIFLTSSSVWAAIFCPRPLNYYSISNRRSPIRYRQPAAMLPEDEEPQKTILRIYEFRTLNEAPMNSFRQISRQYPVYKNPNNGTLSCASSEARTRTVFTRPASEFGSIQKASANTLYYFDEHYETIIREKTHCRFFEAYKKCIRCTSHGFL